VAQFFQISAAVDEITIYDTLYHRYGSIPSVEGGLLLRLIKKAIIEDRRDEIREQWVALLPHMDKETYISFDAYYDRCTGRNIDRRPTEDILSEVEEIRRTING